MCSWVGPHAPPFGQQLSGLPSRVEYLSPQGVLLPLVYGTTASPLGLELRGHSAWQATPSWTVYRLACHRLLPWLRVTFAMVPDAAWPGSDLWPWSTAPATGPVGRLGRPSASDQWGVGSFLSLGHPTCVQCPGLLGSCSPVCPRSLLCCVCGVLGHLAPVHRCARSPCCVACAVSWATWLPFTGVRAVCGARVSLVAVSLFLPPRSLPLPFPCSSLFACLFFFFFCFFFGAVPGCGCVLMPLLVWAWVSWGTGVGWLSRSGFLMCAPAQRLPVSRAPVRGVLTASGWRLWWRGACVGGRGSWVAPGRRGPARARVWVCSWRGLMGWWAVWAWLVCVGVGYVCAEGALSSAWALWALQWVEETSVTPTRGVL